MKVYAREDLKRKLEPNQASDSRPWEACDEKNTRTTLQKRSAGRRKLKFQRLRNRYSLCFNSGEQHG